MRLQEEMGLSCDLRYAFKFIYKAHIDPDNGNVIGSPYLLFKGIISKAKITDDPNKNSVVTWTLTSHWGDFIRVNGRLTVDDSHRALGSTSLGRHRPLRRCRAPHTTAQVLSGGYRGRPQCHRARLAVPEECGGAKAPKVPNPARHR